MSETAKVRLRYGIGGLVLGCFWFLNRHRPPWEEALRTLATFTLLMTLLKARLMRQSKDVHLAPLIAAKAVLVIVAALIQAALGHTMDDPGIVVAIGLGLTVAVLAPLADKRFFTRRTTVLSPTHHETVS